MALIKSNWMKTMMMMVWSTEQPTSLTRFSLRTHLKAMNRPQEGRLRRGKEQKLVPPLHPMEMVSRSNQDRLRPMVPTQRVNRRRPVKPIPWTTQFLRLRRRMRRLRNLRGVKLRLLLPACLGRKSLHSPPGTPDRGSSAATPTTSASASLAAAAPRCRCIRSSAARRRSSPSSWGTSCWTQAPPPTPTSSPRLSARRARRSSRASTSPPAPATRGRGTCCAACRPCATAGAPCCSRSGSPATTRCAWRCSSGSWGCGRSWRASRSCSCSTTSASRHSTCSRAAPSSASWSTPSSAPSCPTCSGPRR
mmetsp:Transcript_2039/g.5334  ORF Transcript_2039/g.5334 Transcript_2039/m.5334 type:complete len:307 (+) Transcript_2039:257-1177(+)